MSHPSHDSARHEQISDLFLAACELPPNERAAYLDRACGHDDELRRQVLELLRHDSADALVDRPAVDLSGVLPDGEIADKHPGRIGRFEILGLLGYGGMGVVYRARQTHPDRVVALKLIRFGAATPAMRRRFEHEVQALGRLRHPGIAQVFEAGVERDPDTGQEWPFVSMEHIEGPSLLQFVRERQLTLAQRLTLFVKICDAVHHAHLKGVIHRDLKPANILVHLDAGAEAHEAQPKILDFGVARLTDAESSLTLGATNVGQIVGTVQYMSPEQASGDPAEIDSRSDVYALGMILFEMLADRMPYDLVDKPLHEAVRIIREREAPALGSIDRRLRGDLETIVAKALEKDKSRRYQSAAELSADVRRYMADEPITAHPPSAMYQLRKFARRHRTLVGGAFLIFVLLVVAVAGTSYGLLVARSQRDAAQRASARAEAVRQFFLNVLTAPAPELAGRDVTVVEALRRAQGQIATAFQDQPELRGDVLMEMAVTLARLGENAQAETYARQALDLRLQHLGESHIDTLNAMNNLAFLLLGHDRRHEPGAWKEADALLERALTLMRAHHADHPEYLIDPLGNAALSAFHAQRYDDAERLTREVLQISARTRGPMHETTLAQHQNLAILLQMRGEVEQAEREMRRLVELWMAAKGPRHPATLVAQRDLATVLRSTRRFDEAERILHDGLPLCREVFGHDHPQTINWLNELGFSLLHHGKLPEAESAYREALTAAKSKLGETDFMTLAIKDSLAQVLAGAGQLEESAALYSQCVEALRAQVGESSDEALAESYKLADVLIRLKRMSDAREVIDGALAAAREDQRDGSELALALEVLRLVEMHQGMADEETIRRLRSHLASFQALAARGHYLSNDAFNRAATLCDNAGEVELAAAYRALIREENPAKD